MNDFVQQLWISTNDLTEHYDHWRKLLLAKPSPSTDEKLTLAFLLHALRAPVENFDQAIDSIKAHDIENKEQQAKLFYLQSLQKRSLGKVEEAYQAANQGLILSQDLNNAIKWRFKLLLSNYLVEMKKVQFGLDQIEEIVESKEQIPNDVMSAARNNFASLCLLFGHYHTLEAERESFDEISLMRLDLHQSMVAGRVDVLEKYVSAPWRSDLKKSPMLTLEIVLATYLFADEELKVKVRQSWVGEYLHLLKGSELFARALWLIDDCVTIQHRRSSSLIENLWNNYFSMLLALKLNESEKAMDILTRELSPSFCELHLFSPLIPQLCLGRLFPDNAISRTLSTRLQIGNKPRSSSFAEVHTNRLIFFDHGNKLEVRLDRATTSLQLLRILAGPAGKKVSKQEIHEQLSVDQYDSYLHDSRIYKLLTRLKERLEQEKVPALWTMYGDNQVELVCDLILR